MASSCAVAIAGFLQIVLRISFFIEQSSDLCSKAPTLASWIFLIAFLDVLLDISIYPVRYMHLPYICQIAVETIVAVFLTEIGTMVVWCTIEKISCKLCKSLLLLTGVSPDFYYSWESYILALVTTSTSVAILFLVGQATDHFYFMRKRSWRVCRKINLKFLQIWCKYSSLMASSKSTNNNEVTRCIEAESFDLNPEILSHTGRNYNKLNRSRVRRTRSRSRKRS